MKALNEPFKKSTHIDGLSYLCGLQGLRGVQDGPGHRGRDPGRQSRGIESRETLIPSRDPEIPGLNPNADKNTFLRFPRSLLRLYRVQDLPRERNLVFGPLLRPERLHRRQEPKDRKNLPR